ncbi:MAG: methyltransferase domain-containing protein [Ruminococcaceae bacterium]|nr:methyltransferase domain-containing protein [Oscillospiraceae bacterium]
MRKILPDKKIQGTLKCPICGRRLSLFEDKSLFCDGAKRHCYDVSSSGYVNLMPPGHADGGDSKAAVAARKRFLGKDYYRVAAEALADTVNEYTPCGGMVIDAGCGEGYYTSAIAQRGFFTAGIDISKHAADAAAKRASASGIEHGFYAVGSVYSLPFFDGSADTVVNVFAPCAEEEFCRVLKNGGRLIVVYAGREHLMGLKRAIYDSVRENDGREDMPEGMRLVEEKDVIFEICVESKEDLFDLFAMTPYYWKTSKEDSEKLNSIDRLKTTVHMIIAVYEKTEE